MLKAIFIVTLLVLGEGHSERAYREAFDYRVVERGEISGVLANGWELPRAAGRRYTLLQPASGAEVYIRLIETDNVGNYQPLRTLGWNAVEIQVQDVDRRVAALEPALFELVGEPAFLTGTDNIRAAQVLGPARELLYLTEVLDPARSRFNIGAATTPVDRVFIMVLGTADVGATAAFYQDRFEQEIAGPFPYRVGVLARAWGQPDDTLYDLSIAQLEGPFLIEIDQYPAAAQPRSATAAGLPYGPAMVSFSVPDLDALARRLGKTVTHPPEAPYAGRGSVLVQGPSGEWIELVGPAGGEP